ncbi:MAG: hypothetical protein HZA31_13095 [Opitutae bacterium]|nr:hypothetical protein [Opitutae bacterium]
MSTPKPAATPGAFAPIPGGALATSARLSLAWFALAFVWLAVGAILLVLNSATLAQPHAHPATVGLTHAWVLGFLCSATFGAVYQLLPVAIGLPLASSAAAWVHLALHGAAVLAIVPAFFAGRYEGVALGGLLAAGGVALFAGNIGLTVMFAPRRDAVAWAFAFSASWLLVTVSVGALAAAHRRWSFLPADSLALLRAHAHLGVVGFFLTLLQGVTFRLVPMFTLAEVSHWPRIGHGLAATQIGLLGLAPSLVGQWPVLQILFALVLAAGVTISGAELIATLRTRRKRVLETGILAFVVGAGTFGLATALGLVLTAAPSANHGLSLRGALVFGLLAIFGGLVTMVGGMLCKIVPFLVWMSVYGPRVGRQPVPLAAHLPSARLERLWWWLHVLSVVVLLLGAGLGRELLLALGAVLVLAATGVFLANQVRVMKHLWRPQTVAAPTPAPFNLSRKSA